MLCLSWAGSVNTVLEHWRLNSPFFAVQTSVFTSVGKQLKFLSYISSSQVNNKKFVFSAKLFANCLSVQVVMSVNALNQLTLQSTDCAQNRHSLKVYG